MTTMAQMRRPTAIVFVAVVLVAWTERARAYDLFYRSRRGTVPAYVSPDMPCRLYFFLPDKTRIREGEAVGLHLDLPAGITPVGLCVHRQSKAADPSKFPKPREVQRDGNTYYRYDLEVPRCVYVDIFLYLTTALEPGTRTMAYYWGSIPRKEGPERKLPLEVVRIHKVRNKPKRLLIGEGWEARGAFLAWPGFEQHYTDLGMNLICLTDFDNPVGVRDKQAMRGFVDRCGKSGIHTAAVLCPGRNMEYYCGATPEVMATTQDGLIYNWKDKKSICPSYRGILFDRSMLDPVRNAVACGISFLVYDYELFGGGKENQYVCFCDRCLTRFRSFFEETQAGLDFVDPRKVILNRDEYPQQLEAWRVFMTDQTADWFRIKKQVLTEECKKHKASSAPGILIGDYGSPAPWKVIENTITYKPKCLENGLDFVQPIFYHEVYNPRKAREKAETIRVGGWRGFAYPAKNLLPWVTPGWTGGGCHTSPTNFRYTMMEVLGNGCHGMIFYDGTGFDGKDFDAVSRVVDMFAPVEDIVIDGEYVIAECDDDQARAHGQNLNGEMVLIVSEYGSEQKTVNVVLPVDRKRTVTDLASGKILGTVDAQNKSLPFTFDQERAFPVHVK